MWRRPGEFDVSMISLALARRKPTLRLGRALRFVWQSGRGWTMASIVLLILQGTLPVLSIYLMKLIIDAVAVGVAAADKSATFRHAALLIALGGLVALLNAACEAIAGFVNEEQSQAVTDTMQGVLHAKAIAVDLEYYENSEYYDALQRAQMEAPTRPTRIVRGLVQLGQSSISLLGIATLIFTLHWVVGVVLFVTLLPGALVRLNYARAMYRWRRSQTLAERKAAYYDLALTISMLAKEIRLFGLGPVFMRRFQDLRRQIRGERRVLARRRAVQDLLAQGIAVLPVFGSYAFIAFQTVMGAITLGGLVMYYQAFQRGQSALQSVLNSLVGLYEDNLFLGNLYEFLDLKPRVAEPANPRPVPRPMRTGIVVDRVDFQYPTSDRPALRDVSLTIRPGEVVALVGENGSGKTTLIKLLCRFYDPTCGSIRIDGIDLREFDTAALRREISVIFQDYVKYQLTARENIWFGNVDLPPHDERIVKAARSSGADDVIAGLANGYETVLGQYLEKGEELSIGEWQKVALARAFLRDSQLIVLDEPSSALDPRSEAEVFAKFRELIGGRSAILISHRLSTVKMADYIYVMSEGRIVESGPHEELMRRSGLYAGLFETQARCYQ